jgi:hypothetical protein
VSPPDERGRASKPGSPDTHLTTDQSSPEQTTAGRLAALETRVTKLEAKRPRRKPKGCITNEQGDVFMPGVGWIRRTAAA